jgi:alpha-1,6-mannosyltransferase
MRTPSAALARLPLPQRADAELGVLDVTEWYGETSGGIRTYLDAKGRYVSARTALRHVIIVPGEQDAVADGDGVRQYRLRGPRIPRHRPYRFLLATDTLARIVRHERPQVIEVGSPFLVPWIMAPVSRRIGVPIVCYHHTNVTSLLTSALPSGERMSSLVRRATHAYLRKLNALAVTTVVASPSARRDLEAAGVERVVEIPLGVDADCFTPDLRENAMDTRQACGLPAGPLFGFVGRFASEKSLGTLLDAWPAVERETGARLVLIGAGPEEARLRAHPYAPRVFFLPFEANRERLAAMVAMLDVLVAPSPHETFGLAALEALSCGTPVLSAHVGGVAEQVLASGAGRLFEAGSPQSLAQTAVALLHDDLAHLGHRGRAYAAGAHSWSVVLDQLFAVYRQVVAQ